MHRWLLTLVYRNPTSTEGRDFWNNIKNLASSINGSWMMVGDYNAIASCEESSGRGGSCNRSYRFADWINQLGKIDLEFSGDPFTWARGNKIDNRVPRRLDPALVNADWRVMFQEANVQHLARAFSDHSPLLIKTQQFCGNGVNRPFRFLASWLEHPQFMDFVKNSWNNIVCFLRL